jgi:hypothetical protein
MPALFRRRLGRANSRPRDYQIRGIEASAKGVWPPRDVAGFAARDLNGPGSDPRAGVDDQPRLRSGVESEFQRARRERAPVQATPAVIIYCLVSR